MPRINGSNNFCAGLEESASDASIGVKIMADLDTKPFIDAT